jgi:ribosomal-protein-alanine N-acetyltransferase
MSESVPVVETERLRLSAFAPEHFDEFARMRADPEVMRYIGTGAGRTRAESAEWLARNVERWRQHNFGAWAVEEKNSRALLGWCGLALLDQSIEVEVGYGFARGGWGRGYATEAARAAVRYGFEQRGLDRIAAVAYVENTASRRVMEKLGMRYGGMRFHYGANLAYYWLEREQFEAGGAHYVLHDAGPV